MDKTLQLAVIGAAHGVNGEVRVKSFAHPPQNLALYDPLYDEAGRSYHLCSYRLQKDLLIARFEGVNSREAAQILNGVTLYIHRDQLADDLGEDDVYQTDLIGLSVQDELGTDVGRICGFYNFGAGDIVELDLVSGKKQMIPFSKAAVPVLDHVRGLVMIDRLAAGLAVEEEDKKPPSQSEER